MSSFRFILTISSHFAKSLSLHFYAAFCQLCRKVLQNSNSPPPINLPPPSSPTEAPPSSRGARQKPARGLLPPPLRRSPHHPTPSPPARYGNNQKSPTLPPATLPHRSTSPLQGETRQRGGQIGRLLYHSTLRRLGAAEGAINRVRRFFGCFFACNEGVLFCCFSRFFAVFSCVKTAICPLYENKYSPIKDSPQQSKQAGDPSGSPASGCQKPAAYTGAAQIRHLLRGAQALHHGVPGNGAVGKQGDNQPQQQKHR